MLNRKLPAIIGYLILLLYWFFVCFFFQDLPEEIPVHYNAAGEPDGYGSRNSIFALPIIATILSILVDVVSRRPENLNYAVKITKENAERQYRNAQDLLQVVKLAVLLIFFFIDYQTIQFASADADGLGGYSLLVIISLLLLPIIIFGYRSYRMK